MIRQKRGAILKATSISEIIGMAGQLNYSSFPGGLIRFTKALAKS
jgi:3-oxoacyl-[acyl-carrier protein] reductase